MVRHREPDEALIRQALEETGSVTAAAVQLGVSRRTVHRWLHALDIRVERRVVTDGGEKAA